MNIIENKWHGKGLPVDAGLAEGSVSQDASMPVTLYQKCPAASISPLLDVPRLAGETGIARLWLKDERNRMGLGSFKALGAAYAIAKQAHARVGAGEAADHARALEGSTFACASAGNHGLSLAAGAPLFGAKSAVFVSRTVPDAFAKRLEAKGATVVREGATYEDSMAAARKQATENGWILLPDSTWPGETEAARDVMEGYLVMGAEIADQIPETPTHVFLQAGVGGLAAAAAVSARNTFGDDVRVVVVEPEAAPALQASIQAGKPVVASGPVSAMGRLDCKEPSHLALKYLACEADFFVTITEDEAEETVAWLAGHGLATTPSGGAGVAALHHASGHFEELGLTSASRVLCYLSEGPEDG